MTKITKEQVLEKIKKSSENPASFHNPNYLIKSCFTEDELSEMDETALNDLLKLAEYASDMFSFI